MRKIDKIDIFCCIWILLGIVMIVIAILSANYRFHGIRNICEGKGGFYEAFTLENHDIEYCIKPIK